MMSHTTSHCTGPHRTTLRPPHPTQPYITSRYATLCRELFCTCVHQVDADVGVSLGQQPHDLRVMCSYVCVYHMYGQLGRWEAVSPITSCTAITDPLALGKALGT